MDFSKVAWWAYLCTAVVAVLFGAMQCRWTQKAFSGAKPRYGLYGAKMLLWAAAMAGAAMIALPLLIVFVLCATLSMLAAMAALYRRRRKESETDA